MKDDKKIFIKKRCMLAGLLTTLVLVIAIAAGVYYYLWRAQFPNDRELAKIIFGIDTKDYTVLIRQKALSQKGYVTEYKLRLLVKEEQMEDLLSKLEEAHYYSLDLNDPRYEDIINYHYGMIKWKLGWEKEEVDGICSYIGSPKNTNRRSKSNVITVLGAAYIKRSENGIYEVYMDYLE